MIKNRFQLMIRPAWRFFTANIRPFLLFHFSFPQTFSTEKNNNIVKFFLLNIHRLYSGNCRLEILTVYSFNMVQPVVRNAQIIPKTYSFSIQLGQKTTLVTNKQTFLEFGWSVCMATSHVGYFRQRGRVRNQKSGIPQVRCATKEPWRLDSQ